MGPYKHSECRSEDGHLMYQPMRDPRYRHQKTAIPSKQTYVFLTRRTLSPPLTGTDRHGAILGLDPRQPPKIQGDAILDAGATGGVSAASTHYGKSCTIAENKWSEHMYKKQKRPPLS